VPIEAVIPCPECGVPTQLVERQLWLNSGVMVADTDKTLRQIFVESENLDPLFAGIAEVIGLSVENQIMDVARRVMRNRVKDMVPQAAKEVILKKEIDLEPLIMTITDYMNTASQVIGHGKFEHLGHRYERDESDYFKNRVTNPYSVPLCRANLAGTIEGMYENSQTGVECDEVEPGVYELTAHFSGHSEALEERLKLRSYTHRDGDIELKKCKSCGGPAALASYQWLLEDGIIKNKATGRRLAMIGPDVLEAVFEELEAELGEAVPQAIIEAQRNFIKSSTYSIEEISNEGDFRTQLAVRGYGNLRGIKVGKDGVTLSIDNAAAHLMIVGMVQGLFEMALDVESNAEWDISEERDLEIKVTPRGRR
jgi:hypothetical protein